MGVRTESTPQEPPLPCGVGRELATDRETDQRDAATSQEHHRRPKARRLRETRADAGQEPRITDRLKTTAT